MKYSCACYFFTLFAVLYSVGAAAPTTTFSAPNNAGSGEMEQSPECSGMLNTTCNSSQEAPMPTEEAELNGTATDSETTQEIISTSQSAETKATTAIPSFPHAPYDCSIASRSQKAHAIASFYKGWSLIVDELNDRVLQGLIQPTNCPPAILSVLNNGIHPNINREEELPIQRVANSIGKMDGYLRLIKQSQSQSYSDDMQALYDVLSGTMQDLYEVLSPTYCANCITPAGDSTSSECFTVPHLRIGTRFFSEDCSLISYISTTISYEMLRILYLSTSWLESQDVRPLPPITNLEWLSSHVDENSPAIAKLT